MANRLLDEAKKWAKEKFGIGVAGGGSVGNAISSGVNTAASRVRPFVDYTRKKAESTSFLQSPTANIADFGMQIPQSIARSAVSAGLSLTGRQSYTPKSEISKLALKPYTVYRPAERGIRGLEGVGASEKTAKTFGPALGIGLTALDLVPGMGSEDDLVKGLVKTTTKSGVKKLLPKVADDVAETIAKTTDAKAIRNLIKPQKVADALSNEARKKYYWINNDTKKFEEAIGAKPADVAKNIDSFVHKSANGMWTVSEGKTGFKISEGKSEKEAVANARAIFADIKAKGGLSPEEIVQQQVESLQRTNNDLSPRYQAPRTGYREEAQKLYAEARAKGMSDAEAGKAIEPKVAKLRENYYKGNPIVEPKSQPLSPQSTQGVKKTAKAEAEFQKVSDELLNKPTPETNISATGTGITGDISPYAADFKDFFRNIEKVTGKKLAEDKIPIAERLLVGKKKFTEDIVAAAKSLEDQVVKTLGISKGSPLSALVQKLGEKKITAEEIAKKYGNDVANRVVQADQFFRKNYDSMIDSINEVRSAIYGGREDKLIPKKENYYRHMAELSDIKKLENIFGDTPDQLANAMSKPNTKTQSIFKKRVGGETGYDAVGGYLDYIKQYSYAKNIDPVTKELRSFAKSIAESGTDDASKNGAMRFAQSVSDLADSLAGKKNKFDSSNALMSMAYYVNNRLKIGQMLGNIGASIGQFGNIPAGAADAGYINFAKGMGKYVADLFSSGGKSAKSAFLAERYLDETLDKFDTSLISKTGDLAKWVTRIGDKIGTKMIWNAQYYDAIAKKVADPMRYADIKTMKIVGGRGIGEMPTSQKSKTIQIIIPFSYEVQNLWHTFGDQIGEKRFDKLVKFAIASYLFNKGVESVRGYGVTFDPVNSIVEAVNAYNSEPDKKVGATKAGGRIAGEVLGNVAGGNLISSALFNDKTKLPWMDEQLTNKELFGKEDPTRFGGGNLITKELQRITGGDYQGALLSLVAGGAQANKTLKGADAYNKGYSESASGGVRYPINQNTENYIKTMLFGEASTPEAREYYGKQGQPLGTTQSDIFKALPQDQRNQMYSSVQSNRAESQMQSKIDKVLKSGKSEQLKNIKGANVQNEGDVYMVQYGDKYKIYDGDSTKTVGSQYDADREYQKAVFDKSGEKQKVTDEFVFTREKSGDISVQTKTQYVYSIKEQNWTNLSDKYKTEDNYKAWFNLASDRFLWLQDYRDTLDPVSDEIEIMRVDKKMQDLLQDAAKYQGYGGFKKGSSGSSKKKKQKSLSVPASATGFISKPTSKLTVSARRPNVKLPKYK